MVTARSTRANWNKLLDDADQPVWVVDAEWRIVLTNSALRQWWGDGGEQLTGQEISFGLPYDKTQSDDNASALAPDPSVFSGRTVQTCIIHPLDPTRILAVQWLPLCDANGEVQSAIAWGIRTATPDQGSPPRITTATDWHALLAEHRARSRGQASLKRFVGESLAMKSLRARADLAARQMSHAWIFGPAGSGRRTLARAIQALRSDADVPFAEWDAALLTPELLQRHVSEFAASQQLQQLNKTPRVTPADVLLLNVELLAADLLPELKQLQERTQVRFLITSNCPPDKLPHLDQWPASHVAEWSTLLIEVPPLGTRAADLPILAQQLVEEINLAGTKQLRGCSLATLELLTAYRWPGDVAELAKVIHAAHAAADGIEIQPSDLPRWLRQAESALNTPRLAPQTIDLDQQLADIEREVLRRAIRLAGGNKTQAAKLVGWKRNRLLRRAEELGLLAESSAKTAAAEPEFIPDLPFVPEGD